jgi:hypothetical protein
VHAVRRGDEVVTCSGPHGNGWHPHLHVLIFCAGTPDPVDLARAVESTGGGGVGGSGPRTTAMPRQRRAVSVGIDPVTTAEDAAEYVAKVQDGRPVGLEVARGDLKAGRLGNVTPFELLDYFRATGDLAALGVWHEYERVTKHRQCIAWSKGLRARLLPDEELSNEEIAAAKVGGEDVAVIPAAAWHVICSVEGLLGQILQSVERGGFGALLERLEPYGVVILRPPSPRMSGDGAHARHGTVLSVLRVCPPHRGRDRAAHSAPWSETGRSGRPGPGEGWRSDVTSYCCCRARSRCSKYAMARSPSSTRRLSAAGAAMWRS